MIRISSVYIATILLILTVTSTSAEGITTNGECTAPNGEPSSCIQLENCTFLYNLFNKKPLLDEDTQFLSRHQCDSLGGKAFVCCPEQYIHTQEQPQGLLPEPGVCGTEISNRVHGGVVSNIHEFPWAALIFYSKGNKLEHHCGGSLINHRYVLTAAHCIRSKSIPDIWKPIRVRLGEWDTSTDRDCKVDIRGKEYCADPHVDIPIESAITYPYYSPMSKIVPHDIGLIRLSRSVNYTDFIRPICLPIRANLRNTSLDGISMDIAGWGLTENRTVSNLKMKAKVVGVNFERCQYLYGRQYVQLDTSQMCAGGDIGVSTCRGDSGGALIALDSSNKSLAYYYTAGIISFGKDQCKEQGWPGVYTKVINFIDWIQQNIHP